MTLPIEEGKPLDLPPGSTMAPQILK